LTFLRPPSALEKSLLDTATDNYHQALLSQGAESHLAYLTEERGFSLETIKRFKLGVVLGQGVLASDEPKRGWLTIPYLSPTGTLMIRYRRPPGSTAPMKYWTSKGDKMRMFNTNALVSPGHWIAICEGEADTMAAVQCGIPAVGVPGVHHWKPYMRNILSGFSRVVVMADNDDKEEQGAKFGEMIAEQLDEVKVILSPKGHDVNSTMLALGPAGLRQHFGIDKHSEG
jgi:DNA primase